MHFQLFLPGGRGQNPQQLVDVGLGDLVAGAEFLDSAEGPQFIGGAGDRVPGVIVAWRKPGCAQMGWQPDKQSWFPAAVRGELAAQRYWLGVWNAAPPRPVDLARPYPQPGRTVMLGDGHEWLLPAARELNADLVLADDGSWRFEVQRKYHAFYLEHLRWFQLFGAAGEDTEFSFADAADFVLSALQINYRLPAELASQLRLFSKETVLAGLFSILGVGVSGGPA